MSDDKEVFIWNFTKPLRDKGIDIDISEEVSSMYDKLIKWFVEHPVSEEYDLKEDK